jgi:SAM-dependent methyltransferase
MDDRTFDEETAREWISIVEGANPSLRAGDIYPRLRSWISRFEPIAVLEIGCGQGVCSEQIDLRRCKYTGIDPSAFLLDRARELYASEGRQFVLGSVYAIPFAAGTFHAVFSVAVWHLLSDLRRGAAELARVLKTGGQFLILTANPNAYSLWTTPYAEKRENGVRFEGISWRDRSPVSKDVLYLHSLDAILASLESAGLTVERTETFRRSENSEGLDFFLSVQGKRATSE